MGTRQTGGGEHKEHEEEAGAARAAGNWAFYDRLMLAVAVAVPALAAVFHVENLTDVAHDGGVVRTVGLGWDGPSRALDAVVAAVFLVLPVGTQTFRAGVASAVVCGVAGGVVYAVIRGLLVAVGVGSGRVRVRVRVRGCVQGLGRGQVTPDRVRVRRVRPDQVREGVRVRGLGLQLAQRVRPDRVWGLGS
ncbi:hypothetical protein [Pendulispora albinea]|uniref:Integral membrane protein n=1 Tax=Pendulispora albinea TaxID=2741071 RepID=A0ABZ2LW69_9BACT